MFGRRIRIIARLRPPSGDPIRKFQVKNAYLTIGKDEYAFDHIYATQSKQSRIFKSEIRTYADDMFSGRSSLVTAMGPTGCGKSFSLFGKEAEDRGMVLRVTEYLLERITSEFELRAWIYLVHKDSVDNMIHSNMLQTTDEEIPIRSIEDLSVYLARAVESRKQLALANKDPKLRFKSHFVIRFSLHKIINNDYHLLSSLIFLDTAGFEFYSNNPENKVPKTETSWIRHSFNSLIELITEGTTFDFNQLTQSIGDNIQNYLVLTALDLSKQGFKHTRQLLQVIQSIKESINLEGFITNEVVSLKQNLEDFGFAMDSPRVHSMSVSLDQVVQRLQQLKTLGKRFASRLLIEWDIIRDRLQVYKSSDWFRTSPLKSSPDMAKNNYNKPSLYISSPNLSMNDDLLSPSSDEFTEIPRSNSASPRRRYSPVRITSSPLRIQMPNSNRGAKTHRARFERTDTEDHEVHETRVQKLEKQNLALRQALEAERVSYETKINTVKNQTRISANKEFNFLEWKTEELTARLRSLNTDRASKEKATKELEVQLEEKTDRTHNLQERNTELASLLQVANERIGRLEGQMRSLSSRVDIETQKALDAQRTSTESVIRIDAQTQDLLQLQKENQSLRDENTELQRTLEIKNDQLAEQEVVVGNLGSSLAVKAETIEQLQHEANHAIQKAQREKEKKQRLKFENTKIEEELQNLKVSQEVDLEMVEAQIENIANEMENLKKENNELNQREIDLVKENRKLEREFAEFRIEAKKPLKRENESENPIYRPYEAEVIESRPFSPVVSTIPQSHVQSPTRALRELQDYREKQNRRNIQGRLQILEEIHTMIRQHRP